MASEIIPVVSKDGYPTSVSIDYDLFCILRRDFKSKSDCLAWIRSQAKLVSRAEVIVAEGLTRKVRYQCLVRIARPSLIRMTLGEEAQMDFEEI